ncbi:MAG: MerR family transcriptional regulator [Clostridiales bacterium]|jgi:DNA-binding transcriptional MerR regulator|nr:MerR family transcriptional regulator [Clostridiales bacterium]
MKEYGYLTVRDFAKLTRTTRDTLYHYDNIGLLSPVSRGENRYRYYQIQQLAIVNVVRILQQSGLALAEIKELIKNRTPEQITQVLANRIEGIDKEISVWMRARKLLVTLRSAIQSVSDIDENALTIQFLQAEAIIRGNLNDYSGGRTEYDNLEKFYRDMHGAYPDLDLNYPVWGVFSCSRVKNGDWKGPDRYYFYNPDGCDIRPAALYAIGYDRGGYGQTDELYKRMIKYIEKNGFEIDGDTYEEYPLNEVSVSDDNYLVRLMISVREKQA